MCTLFTQTFIVIQISVGADASCRELQCDTYVPASSFTPINRPAQQPTPQSSTFTSLGESTQEANRGRQREKRRNPGVASYLGLGGQTEPSHLENYAPALPPTPATPPRGRKRIRKKQDGSSPSKNDAENRKPAKQKRISEALRVTKPVPRGTVGKYDATMSSASVVSRDILGSAPVFNSSGMHMPFNAIYQTTDFPNSPREVGTDNKGLPSKPTLRNHDVQSPSDTMISTATRISSTFNDFNTDHRSLGHDRQDTIADDDFDDIFDMIDLDNTTDTVVTNAQSQRDLTRSQHQITAMDHSNSLRTMNDRLTDEDLFFMTAEPTNDNSSPLQPITTLQSFPDKSQSDTTESTGITAGPVPSSSRSCLRKFKSPRTPKTDSLIQKAVPGSEMGRKPIVRPPFPTPVRDRSPVIGLSPYLLLRTCFRIGEAINQACHAVKHGQKVIFELYAKVLSSHRNEARQDFVFHDLFHDKPPYIKGVYHAVIWRGVRLYDYDSQRLLEEKKLCRCIGTIKRDGKEWIMEVLNAWEAKWEDVAWVEGIVSA
jgi:hypothetical protein